MMADVWPVADGDGWCVAMGGRFVVKYLFNFKNLISKSVKYLFQVQILILKALKYLVLAGNFHQRSTLQHRSMQHVLRSILHPPVHQTNQPSNNKQAQ